MTQLKRLSESDWEKNFAKKYKVTSMLSKRFSNKIYDKSEWKKNFAKKFKSTSRLLARFSSKINDEINCYNKITVDHVNDDCLAEIFMYVPACERPKIALVCKQWKRVLDDYSWFNVKKLELTYWKYDEYPNYLIKHYPTIDGQLSFLKSLLNKCGRYLTELDLTAYGHCNIIPVINESCQNLVKLRIRIKCINGAMLRNAFTGLSKLKVLKIIFQCYLNHRTYEPVILIKSLLNVADTLTELNLSNWSGWMECNAKFPEEFTSVVSKLKSLKTFQTAGMNCSESLIDYFLSRSPGLIAHYDECTYQEDKIDITEIYEDIKKLDMKMTRVTDDFLYNVTNQMRQLHTLKMYCECITDAGIVAISKMNHLRKLDCYGYNNNITDSSIKLLKNKLFLVLPFSNKITDESAIKVLENSPELEYFSVQNTGITFEFIKKAEEISRNREKQLTVVKSFKGDMRNTKIRYDYLTVNYVKRDEQQNTN